MNTTAAQDEITHARLQAQLCAEIAQNGGVLPFARFMATALYAPQMGYYATDPTPFGASGDFVTAPEISPLFAACLARHCAVTLQALQGGIICEVGAGSGVLAADLLLALDALHALPEYYLLIEISAALRERQRATLAQRAPHLLARCVWRADFPATGVRGIILANELLDALPAAIFQITADGVMECGVEVMTHTAQATTYGWRLHPPTPDVATAVEIITREVGTLPVGYKSEVSPAVATWMATAAHALQAGELLLIDYGFGRREYYHPQRTTGTLMCHHRHRAHPDPLVYVGQQDITAHVDFTRVAECGVAAGLELAGYTHQAGFLLNNGLAEHLPPPQDTRAYLAAVQQVKKLTLPSEMGELFKVMAFTRNLEVNLPGFAIVDLRSRL